MPLRSYTHPPSGREDAANDQPPIIPLKKYTHIEHSKVAGKIMGKFTLIANVCLLLEKKGNFPANYVRYCMFIEWKVHLKL